SEHLDVVCFSLLGTAALSTGSLGLRWLRWHFLTRLFDLYMPAKDSLKLYLVTLPAIITPFHIGELVRAALLHRRYPHAGPIVSGIWLIERCADVSLLAAFFCMAKGWWLLVVALGLLWSIMAFTLRSVIQHTTGRTLSKCVVLLPIFLSSCAAWLLPIVSLWGILWMQGSTASGRLATEAFAVGTLLGGIAGVPLGIGITGSAAVIHLKNHGVPLEIAALSIAILRAGTAWYAL